MPIKPIKAYSRAFNMDNIGPNAKYIYTFMNVTILDAICNINIH